MFKNHLINILFFPLRDCWTGEAIVLPALRSSTDKIHLISLLKQQNKYTRLYTRNIIVGLLSIIHCAKFLFSSLNKLFTQYFVA